MALAILGVALPRVGANPGSTAPGNLGKARGIHRERTQVLGIFCPELTPCPCEETVLSPLPAPETGVPWAHDRKCLIPRQDCLELYRVFRTSSCLPPYRTNYMITINLGL